MTSTVDTATVLTLDAPQVERRNSGLAANPTAQTVARLAGCAVGVTGTAVVALESGRVAIAFPVLGGALALLAAAGAVVAKRAASPPVSAPAPAPRPALTAPPQRRAITRQQAAITR